MRLAQTLTAAGFKASLTTQQYTNLYAQVHGEVANIAGDGRPLPTSIEEAATFGLDLFRDYASVGIAEPRYLRYSLQALQNIVGSSNAPKIGTVWSVAQPLLEDAGVDWPWLLAPLGLSNAGQADWIVFFPVAVRLTAATTSGTIPANLVQRLPNQVEALLNRAGWTNWVDGPFLEVHSKASTPELARALAAGIAARFWSSLFLFDRFRRLWHEFNSRVALVCTSNLTTVTPLRPDNPLPVTGIDTDGLKNNWTILSDLETSPRSWCRQLGRGLYFLRLGEESDEQETRFLHLWRALEAALGHLTGVQALAHGKDAFRYDIVALVRLLRQQPEGEPIAPIDEKVLLQEVDSVRTEMQPILEIRNLWAFHPADERDTAIPHVTHSALEDANDWLKDNVGHLITALLQIALASPSTTNRFDVANELRRVFGLDPMVVEKEEYGVGARIVGWFIREVEFRFRKLGIKLPR